jgi:protein-disulfide isomerase
MIDPMLGIARLKRLQMADTKRLISALVLALAIPAGAQIAMPLAGATAFKDTSALRPPAGAKVAIIEFEDLECPLCAHVSPMVRDAMNRYRIPRVHYDFIIPGHMWSRSAAFTPGTLRTRSLFNWLRTFAETYSQTSD